MSLKPTKVALISKIESTYAIDSVPTGAANAILVCAPKLSPLVQDVQDRTILRPFIGNGGKVNIGEHVGLDYGIEMAGSGAAGTAPGYGPNLKSCAMQEITNPTAVAGTAQAGSAAQLTLAVGASATDNAYRYMTIRATAGTGIGQSATIRSYTGATKVAVFYESVAAPFDATTVYSIDPQVVYVPISTQESSRSSYFNMDGMQHNMLGVRGDMSLKLSKGGIPMFNIKDLGLYVQPSDTAMPTVNLSTFTKPVGFSNENTSVLLHGYAVLATDISFALGNSNVYRNIAGFEGITFATRKASGAITFEHPTIAAKNFYALAYAGTLGSLNVTSGNVAGNKVKVYCPAVQLINPNDSADAVRLLGITLDPQPVDGGDEIILTVF